MWTRYAVQDAVLEDKLEGELKDDDLELVHLGLGGSSIWMKMGNTLIVKQSAEI